MQKPQPQEFRRLMIPITAVNDPLAKDIAHRNGQIMLVCHEHAGAIEGYVTLSPLAGPMDEGLFLRVSPKWARPVTPAEAIIGQWLVKTFWTRVTYTEDPIPDVLKAAVDFMVTNIVETLAEGFAYTDVEDNLPGRVDDLMVVIHGRVVQVFRDLQEGIPEPEDDGQEFDPNFGKPDYDVWEENQIAGECED